VPVSPVLDVQTASNHEDVHANEDGPQNEPAIAQELGRGRVVGWANHSHEALLVDEVGGGEPLEP
jgi:hypothetical protein